MKIKDRLSLYFSLIMGGLLILVMAVVYFVFQESMRSDFYKRLRERTSIIGGLYLEADEISPVALEGIRKRLLQKIPGEVFCIYNSKGDPVFVPDNRQYWGRSVISEVKEKEYVQFNEGRRQVAGRLYHDNQGDFIIISSAIDEGTYHRLDELLKIMIGVFFIVMLLTYYSGRILAKKLLSPIDRLINRIAIISASNLDMRVEAGNRKDEISVLADNFNGLLERLQNSFTLQGTFVANVTHELRTPVTSIIGETEVALKHDRAPEEYRAILRSVLNDSVRLKETISGMLELAHVNSDFSHAPLALVRVDELLWELNDYWNNTAGVVCIKTEMTGLPEDESALLVRANKRLLYIALNNVIGNAFKFSEGKIVLCSLTAGAGVLKINIKDFGKGIDPEEYQKILDPFYRSQQAVEFAGTGMGLYIANRIVSMFKGNLGVSESDSNGTTISISLPSASD